MSLTKILLVASEFPPQPGGIGNHAYQVAKHLCALQYKVTVVTDIRSANSVEEAAFDSKQAYSIVRILRKSPLLFTYIKRIVKTKRLLKSHDIVLVSGKFPIWLGGLLSLTTSKKIYAVIHGSEVATTSNLKMKLTRWSLRKFETVIAVSNFTKSLVANWGLKKIVVIPNGFSIPVHLEIKKKQATKPLRLITVGNVTQRKGQHNVIKALPILKGVYPEIRYDIVGIPTEKNTLQQLAESLAVKDVVVFHGKVSEERKMELLSQATIFVMLSETTKAGDVEGFGIAILEANALAIPAIGATGCGIEDAISHKKSGILVHPSDVAEIEAAIAEILKNYEHYQTEARHWSTTFTWDGLIKRYVAILNK